MTHYDDTVAHYDNILCVEPLDTKSQILWLNK